jgi:hypothetical protein
MKEPVHQLNLPLITDMLFKKVASNLKIAFDIEKIEKTFIEDQMSPSAKHLPFSHPSGKPHWQKFPTNIKFARNINSTFPDEMQQLSHQLLMLQEQCRNDKILSEFPIVKIFNEHQINSGAINFIKILPGSDVEAHCDKTRNLALNIGLKNSNSCSTYVIDGTDHINFWNNPTYSYTMNDGDAWLLSVKNAHALKSHVTLDSNIIRYILTYNIAEYV